jgi:RNA recognition motif-containing protein
MNIYVGNLAYSVTQDELREAFRTYGQIDSANLITDRVTGESKGFGFVDMPNNTEADAAIKADARAYSASSFCYSFAGTPSIPSVCFEEVVL